MIELRQGMFNLLKRIIGDSSVALAVIYTLGHIVIAMVCNNLITGAEWKLAAADALIEPIINGFWFYALHKAWRVYNEK